MLVCCVEVGGIDQICHQLPDLFFLRKHVKLFIFSNDVEFVLTSYRGRLNNMMGAATAALRVRGWGAEAPANGCSWGAEAPAGGHTIGVPRRRRARCPGFAMAQRLTARPLRCWPTTKPAQATLVDPYLCGCELFDQLWWRQRLCARAYLRGYYLPIGNDNVLASGAGGGVAGVAGHFRIKR